MLAASVPAKFSVPFANSAGGSYIHSIPTASQIGIVNGAASLTDGFPPLNFTPVASGGVPPFGQDMNGILNQISAWTRWVSAGAPIAYDATFSAAISGYPAGALVLSAVTPGLFWLSTTDNNVTNPDAAGAGWVSWSLQRGAQVFTANGTFTSAATQTYAWLSGCGAGGGGGGAASNAGSCFAGGGGGGGAAVWKTLVTVTPSTPYTVTIAATSAGGAGTTSGGATGGTGTTSATSFGALLTLAGGSGGTGGSLGGGTSGGGGAAGGAGGLVGGTGSGMSNPTVSNGLFPGGPGGASLFGSYGRGGAGGGAGRASGVTDSGLSGSAGGLGFMLVEW